MQMYKKYFLYRYALSGSRNKRFYTNMHCQDPQISVFIQICQDPQISVAEDSLIFKGMGGAEMQVGPSGNQDPGI